MVNKNPAVKKTLIITTPDGNKYAYKTTKNYTHVVFDKMNLKERRESVEGSRAAFIAWYAQGDCKDGRTLDEWVSDKVSAEIESINKLGSGEFSDAWFVCGYCSRLDLAEKIQKKNPNSIIMEI